jgi:hypothetical protein
LHGKWENHHSLIMRDCGNISILPTSEIENSSDKVTCLEFDDVWSTSTQSIDNVLDGCVDLPVDLRASIREKYQTEHCDKSRNILRLSCAIQRLHMKEIDYAFDQMPGNMILLRAFHNTLTLPFCLDETYTFCVYGEDETNVYDNQYPYKCCGRFSCSLL